MYLLLHTFRDFYLRITTNYLDRYCLQFKNKENELWKYTVVTYSR